MSVGGGESERLSDRTRVLGVMLFLVIAFLAAGYRTWNQSTEAAESTAHAAQLACATHADATCVAVEPDYDRTTSISLYVGAGFAALGAVLVMVGGGGSHAPGTAIASRRKWLLGALDDLEALRASGRLTDGEYAAARRRLFTTR
jgi:hypothetical protein